MRVHSLLGIVAALSSSVIGAPAGGWDALRRLSRGDLVRVTLSSGAPVEAVFEAWTENAISVGSIRIAREQVNRVELRKRGWGRGKKAAVGALVGFGSGFLIGFAGTPSGSGSTSLGTRTENGGTLAVLGAVAGAAIGAALPNHRYELIYQRPGL